MDKSLLVKIVWLGAIAAIPLAVLSLQKPQVTLPVETKRVITVDKPVAVDIRENEVKPLETAKPLEPAPKPRTMWVGGGKIVSKTAPAPQGETAKDDHAALPAKDPSKLTASVAPSPGPRAQ